MKKHPSMLQQLAAKLPGIGMKEPGSGDVPRGEKIYDATTIDYQEFHQHLITGSVNQMKAAILTAAAQDLKNAIVKNLPDCRLRQHVLELAWVAYASAMAVLALQPSSDKHEGP